MPVNCKLSVLESSGSARCSGRRIGGARCALVLLNYAAQLLGAVWYRFLAPQATTVPAAVTWLLSFLPLYGVAFPVYCTLLQRIPRVRPPHRRVGAAWLAGTACIAVALLYAGALAGNGVNALIGLLRGRPADNGLDSLRSSVPLWQIIVFPCLLAPIGEELIFNLLLERALPFGEKQAILFCALAFGAFHGNLYQFFYAFLVRLVLANLYLRSGRLAWCMALHALLNLLGSLPGVLVLPLGEKAIAAYGAALLLVIITGIVLLVRRWDKKPRPAASQPQTKTAWLFASPGTLAAFGLCLVMTVLALQ